ncbi:hypothetical protein ACF3NA_06520 [Alkanindiges sp. WGS2144]|uniref:hypothetical protein n=1 Tax=Alkanindiges sp. WGS2144 TaxID=3366808 RepID=UPI0037535426
MRSFLDIYVLSDFRASTVIFPILEYFAHHSTHVCTKEMQWRSDYDSDLQLEYSGEAYSILSQDTIWDAITDHQAQATRWIRLGLNAIDNES